MSRANLLRGYSRKCILLLVSACIFNVSAGDDYSNNDCPDTPCICHPEGLARCTEKGLTAIPAGIPSNIKVLQFNRNPFSHHTLHRSNLSRFENAAVLFLSECSLEYVEPDAFRDLKELRLIHLSYNNLKVIEAGTFSGLRLNDLMLSHNPNLQLTAETFKDASVSWLFLHDCPLKELDSLVLQPLAPSLTHLFLDGNEFETLDQGFYDLFTKDGIHISMGGNPWRCDCKMAWLKAAFDKNEEAFSFPEAPKCQSPARLQGKGFDELKVQDFSCELLSWLI